MGLLTRANAMLLRPARTWSDAAGEPAVAADLMKGYVVPLAAIGPVCGVLGGLAFHGDSIFGVNIRPPVRTLLVTAASSYLMTLLGVVLAALAVERLAPLFGGARDRGQAFKLVVYSGTALWATGIFSLYPALGWLMAMLGALGSLYSLRLGLPKLMGIEEDRSLVAFALIFLVIALIAAALSLLHSVVLEALDAPLWVTVTV